MPRKKKEEKGGEEPQMDFSKVHACVDVGLPPQLQGEALTQAVNERPDNILMPDMAPGVGIAMNTIEAPAMAVVAKKLWKPGRTLRVRFMDNPPKKVREKIEQYAREWEKHANVRFVFGNDPKAEIRITCTPGIGSWSYLGTDALTIPKNKPTMNYGWFTEATPDTEFSRTVLHEFGHALGCIHEHMNPTGSIPWNRDAVYRYYMSTQGWTRERVDSQLFAKYSLSQLNASSYDPDSIMHYPVPKDLTLDGFEVGWNRKLSARDKQFIAQQYPK